MSKKLLFTFILFTCSISIIFAQCNDIEENNVLLIGDSWAFFMTVDGTINTVFDKWGHTNKRFVSSVEVAVNGARTTDFLEQDMQVEVRDLIVNNPSIDVVHLSIGGNDVLGQWNINFTPTELADLIDEVYLQTLEIIDFIKTTKPGIKIVFSGYVYPNFGEVIDDSAPFETAHPFYSRWQSMGYPSFLQINTILNDFSDLIETYSDSDPQVAFFKAPGLMQYTFGQNDNLGVAPGGNYPPFTQSLPYGDPNYPSPKNSMRDYIGITKDCFHLSAKGYRDLIGLHTQKFYHKHLMADQYILSNNSLDAGVSSQGLITPLQIGSQVGDSFGSILDFSTTDMNWGAVEKAEIFLQISSITGDNPLGEPLEISIKSGDIGSNASVEASDWNASVDAVGTPCVFGNINSVGDWIRIELPASFLPYLSDQTNTQFLIKGTNSTDGVVAFTNASDPEFAPVLNIKYDDSYTPIKDLAQEESIQVFPNPAQNFLWVSCTNKTYNTLTIIDALGRVQRKETLQSAAVNIENLNTGLYQLVLDNGQEFTTTTFMKK